ncbi:ATP-binding protein [Chondrinema litorale]|uniref:ATP-binding protein n=1 Tax=Chondrinema litorale TaxID=2994555 RepID=UPI002543817C|nr:ATP-binding protein [Chondrinema litorale]UZR97175.1 ATP-binding protein [Chondrinema litorale]
MDHLRAFFDNANFIFCIYDAELKLVDINKEALSKFKGLKKEDLVGKHITEISPDIKNSDRLEKYKKVLATGESYDTRHFKPHPLYGIATGTVKAFKMGECIGMVGFDVTEWKKAEDDLKIALEERDRLIKDLKAFNFLMSHDLREPLRAIIGYSEILNEEYSDLNDGNIKHMTDRILKRADKMEKLIEDVLVFTRLRSIHTEIAEINMEELFHEIYADLTEDIQEREIDFRLNNLQPTKGDLMMIGQLLSNLLSNAIKYTKPIEKAIIQINGEKLNEEYVYSIKDNGVGFDMNNYGKLFQEFQRLHKKRDFDGNGLGLAIASRVIELHNGKIWADSKTNEGATFYFSIPG